MSPAFGGALLGAVFGLALWRTAGLVMGARRTSIPLRVLPYIRDLPGPGGGAGRPLLSNRPLPTWRALLEPLLGRGAAVVERILGGSSSIERRLVRAGLDLTVHDFRVSQVVWGLIGFAAAAVPAALVALDAPDRTVPLVVFCLAAGVLGVLLRENRLSAAMVARERQMLQEFPAVAGLLALAVAAGEGPAAALARVVARAHGALATELRAVLAAVQTGVPVTTAFDDLAGRTGLPVVARFAESIAIAVERGTPLADVLHAQAGDVREAGRRALIETGARKEVLMMVPVVFLVMPTVVVFAFFPGLIGLRMVV
ncbi:type II secretion system F family protein [Nocardioides terrisoli]|uniref:type II secretion system F family protein n=1 Tax=Nocardioides terrisoli TaxID=3388267 RepID=UPI00287B8A60|nr:type II secretion system F family protein [Nocardioides marmorisolisilvae]